MTKYDDVVAQLSDEIPFLLFPVRLETRFRGSELLVRIYPDDVGIDSHEPALTADEVAAATTFWTEYDAAAGDAALQLGAWRALLGGRKAPRAAWIAQAVRTSYTTKETTWSRPATAPLLPDYFVLIGIRGGVKVVELSGAPIPRPLPVSFDPALSLADEGIDVGGMRIDPGIEWMVNFEKAVEVGMGVRIPLDREWAATGFDRLLALGVRGAMGAPEGAADVEALLTSHRYVGDGISLIPVGTPTNNTESGASGFSSVRLDDEESLATEHGEPLVTTTGEWQQKQDGQCFAEALGISLDVVQHVQHAGDFDQRNARAMNTALWPATAGYFLEEMLRPLVSSDVLAETRDFFLQYVSGRGPIPSVRVGTQPYGVLLTTAFSRWTEVRGKQAPGLRHQLHQLLIKVGRDWDAMSRDVTRVGASGDPYGELLDVLGLHPSTVELYQRFAPGAEYLENYQRFLGVAQLLIHRWRDAVDNDAQGLLDRLGITAEDPPAIAENVFFDSTTLLDGPLVDDAPLSTTDPVRAYTADGRNYLAWLAESALDDIRVQRLGDGGEVPDTLLYLLLRHGLLLSYWDTGMQLRIGAGASTDHDRREQQLLYVQQGNSAASRWAPLYEPVASVTPSAQTLAEYLATPAALATDAAKQLRDVRESIALLAAEPTASLETAFTEHIDLCSYRVDAWLQGLLAARLTEMRALHARGTYVGAFGWLENVRPGATRTTVDAAQIPEAFHDAAMPLTTPADNAGFLQAPSLPHAAAAAVLRNAYLTHASEDDAEAMAIDLSSGRVRAALDLLDGVRSGQTLGELLGYQFERGLHDRHELVEVDKLIAPLRKAFPLVADRLTTSSVATPARASAASTVLNGLAFVEKVKTTGVETYPFGISSPALPAATAAEAAAIDAEVARLRDALDGVADLALSESVFQVVSGNHDRAGAMMKAVSEGRNPPDPEIARTPRTGRIVSHRVATRVAAGFALDDDSGNPYTRRIPYTPRARIEPGVNRWLATCLGDPANIVCSATHARDDGGEDRLAVTVEDLGLQPIDLLYVMDVDLNQGSTEIDARIALHARDMLGLAGERTIAIEYLERQSDWGLEKKTFFEIAPLVAELRRVVAGSRALDAQALSAPSDGSALSEASRGVDLTRLEERSAMARAIWQSVADALDAAYTALNDAVEPYPSTAFDAARAALADASMLGIQRTIPTDASGESTALRADLLDRVAAAAAATATRLAEYDDAVAYAAADTTDQKTDRHVAAVRALLPGFAFLPEFTVANLDELTRCHTDATSLLREVAAPLPVETWARDVACVRPKMSSFMTAATLIAVLEETGLELTVLQLPWAADDCWVALSVPSDYLAEGERLCLTLCSAAPFDAAALQSGIVIDEWTEVVPNEREMTAVAFHYDRPNQEAPQTLLLVVPPAKTGAWQWNDLVDALSETLDAAKQRAVEPQAIDRSAYAQFLPAIMTAATRLATTLSLNLADNVTLRAR